jgi:hypothetical protein
MTVSKSFFFSPYFFYIIIKLCYKKKAREKNKNLYDEPNLPFYLSVIINTISSSRLKLCAYSSFGRFGLIVKYLLMMIMMMLTRTTIFMSVL